MNIQNWKIFDKSGSLLNWTPDPLIQLIFESPSGKGAEGYLVTDASGIVVSTEILKGGYSYGIDDTSLSYAYALESGTVYIPTPDVSITLKDVSIFGSIYANGSTSKSINSISLNLSANFVYPSATYAAAVFLKPVSIGLVETEHLFILEDDLLGNIIRPYDASNSIIVMSFIGDDSEIQFFEVNEDTAEITWANSIDINLNTYSPDTPLQINIGFRAEMEGVFERILRIYHLVGDTLYTLADIVVNAESIGEDERFRSLLTNFGAPDPIDIKDIFKETNINEDLPDWNLLNYKSKHMILEHDKIMPYVGTYKGLINAIKWLGYDDIYIREWFMNVKENTKISFIIPYDTKDRTQTILMFNEDQRKVLKKLNQLSLSYCLTRETGSVDDWGVPQTENCYSYNIKEIFIKLLGLKQWLERTIIGVNARITDITGEGIYIERIQNLVYTTDNIGFDYSVKQNLTPYSIEKQSELASGGADILLSIKELKLTRVSDLPYKFSDFIDFVWNPNDPSTYYSITDSSYLSNPGDFLVVGAPLKYPFVHIKDVMYVLSVEKEFAGTLGNTLVTNPLFIIENDIRFYNTFDSSSVFHDSSTSLTLYFEKAYFRDPSIDEWVNSIAYSIYPNPSENGYIMESSTGIRWNFDEYVTFNPDVNSLLQYAVDDNYKVPLLSMKNYRTLDANGINTLFDKTYYLDILDGKIEMNAGMINPVNSSDNSKVYLNFNYDTDIDEQMITVNIVSYSPRMILYQVDPSTYYWADPIGRTGGNDPSVLFIDNSIYAMHVNHIGDYNIEIFAWDDYNTLFYNSAKESHNVWIKTPTLYTLIDQKCSVICSSIYMSIDDVNLLIANNKTPIYDRIIPLQGLTFEIDNNGIPYIKVPSITFFQDIPTANSINKFYNLTERVTGFATYGGSVLYVDTDFQEFRTGDDIKVVKFDNGKYSFISDVSAFIIGTSFPPLAINLDASLPRDYYDINSSTSLYVLNNTYRPTTNAANVGSNLVIDVCSNITGTDPYVFKNGQLVSIIVTNASNGYSWGSSYRVLASSGGTHIFNSPLPDFFINDPSKYTIRAKHAYSTYANLSMLTDIAIEANNEFKIYPRESYCQEYYLDNTFTYINILFDQDTVNEQWYEESDNLINDTFYYHSNPINVDISTLVILRALYEPSSYLLNQKNIWQVVNHDSSIILFKVFNDTVPYVFNEKGTYNVECTSYDIYGNAITKMYEGLIIVN